MSEGSHVCANEHPAKRALLLAIRPAFAEKLLSGQKKYELRKSLPRERIDRVYLYVSGGGGVIGCFDVDHIIAAPLDELWDTVGEEATSKDRFFKYFSGWDEGVAIAARSPVRFIRPVLPAALRQREPAFIAPQGFLYLHERQSLMRYLEARRRESLDDNGIKLVPIESGDRDRFIDSVTQEIAPRYDDITRDYALNLLAVHDRGADPHGILTSSKEVFSVKRNSQTIGFCVFTYKLGGSLKTGPTVLLPRWRRKGYGQRCREAIEAMARHRGVRKLYCTCPDNEPRLVAHFLRAGYRIEAHLAGHYQPHRGELVFGRILQPSVEPAMFPHRTSARPVRVVQHELWGGRDPISVLADLLDPMIDKEAGQVANRLLRAHHRAESLPFEQKPLRLVWLASGEQLAGAVVLMPKRGGAMKGILLSNSSHGPSINRVLDTAELLTKERGHRKVYFVVPTTDWQFTKLLVGRGYRTEGVLREPLKAGQDSAVHVRFV